MKYIKLILFLLTLTSTHCVFAQTSDAQNKTIYSAGFMFGDNTGLGLQLNVTIQDFAEDFPFDAKIAGGITFFDAGKPIKARSVFINDNTNGIPHESGRTIDFRIDLLLPFSSKVSVNAGPRFIAFAGNINFVGGSEDYDVTGNQWEVGSGVETRFNITNIVKLVFNVGYDYYFENSLYGHDTSYSPDNEKVNPRKDYNFADADRAVSQPLQNVRAMFGFSYNF